MAKVLITGGTGMIGRALTTKLIERGFSVHTLSRSPAKQGTTPDLQFYWDPQKGEMDAAAIDGIAGVVHLAGAGLADKPWTKSRKREIIDSRVKSAELLKKTMHNSGHEFQFFVSASGGNYYGTQTSETIFTESDAAGDDFLAECCVLWEKSAFENNPAKRVVALRTAMVLSNSGGALPKLGLPSKWGFGAILGSGKQYSPWIHIDDLVSMYILSVEREDMQGAFNAVADEQPTHQQLMHEIAHANNRKIWLPKIPSGVLKLALGEMSSMLLKGSRLSNEKIKQAGFTLIKFPKVSEALRDLIRTP